MIALRKCVGGSLLFEGNINSTEESVLRTRGLD